MHVHVRLGVGLASLAGNPRLAITLTDGATVADLIDHLRTEHPNLAQRLDAAIPMISGRHVAQSEPLTGGQELALLLPVAGGFR